MYGALDGSKFGWQSAVSGTPNPVLDDFVNNGRVCQSGLAFESNPSEATCASASNVTFAGNFLN
jgi:hypothetical protein